MMAGGIYEQYGWPEERSDYVEVCDGCRTAIWSTRWNEETSDGFDSFLARNGWHEYIDQLDSRMVNLCPECALRAPSLVGMLSISSAPWSAAQESQNALICNPMPSRRCFLTTAIPSMRAACSAKASRICAAWTPLVPVRYMSVSAT